MHRLKGLVDPHDAGKQAIGGGAEQRHDRDNVGQRLIAEQEIDDGREQNQRNKELEDRPERLNQHSVAPGDMPESRQRPAETVEKERLDAGSLDLLHAGQRLVQRRQHLRRGFH